jgi:glycosyltransferase involved in cell wall biosynthesis
VTYHLVAHRLTGRVGHRLAEAQALADELARRGIALRLYVHEKADRDITGAFPAARAVLTDPVFAKLPFDRRTEMFAGMLHRHLEPEIAADDRVLTTVATQCEARAFTRWMSELPRGRKPWAIVYMISDRWNHGGEPERERQSSEWAVVRAELQAAKAEDRQRLIFSAATNALAEEIGAQLGAQVMVASTPIPGVVRPPGGAARASEGLPRVGVLGGARPEKGSALIPEIVPRVRARAPVEFIVQVKNEKLPEPEFGALEAMGRAAGVRAFTEPGEYEARFDESDVLLLPYQRTPYARRTSGIFLEAALAGKPVVVPEGTWMADQVAAGRAAGVVFSKLTPEDVADAVLACLRDYPRLRARALELASAWRESEGVGAFVERLEQEISLRSARAGA